MMQKKQLGALTLVVGLGCANLAQAAYDQNQSPSYQSQTSDATRGAQVSDDALTAKIQNKIGSKYSQVTAQVSNGVVSLQGSVKTWEEKQQIENQIRNVNGVKGVNSQIVVEESRGGESQDKNSPQVQSSQMPKDYQTAYNDQHSWQYVGDNQPSTQTTERQAASSKDFPQDRASSAADEQLNKKIRDKVSKGWFSNSYKEIALITNNGFVVLEGVVENPKEQEKLITELQKIPGVQGVRSNLSVKKIK
jgi:osmotically-inducible protein OsmY